MNSQWHVKRMLYSINQLYELMTAEGLTAPPTLNKPAGPMAKSKFAKMLRNRYYIGVVTYRGVEYPGKHELFVSPELFARVGAILDDRDRHSLKQRIHQHYLRGQLSCRRCGGRLMYTEVTGKAGGTFAYFVCGKRHHAQGCKLPYAPADGVEDRIAGQWPQWVRLEQIDADTIGQLLHELVTSEDQEHVALETRSRTHLARLDKERRKLLAMAYAEAIPMDLLKSEQERIAREQAQAERQLATATQSGVEVEQFYAKAREVMTLGAGLYAVAGPGVRRQLNQALIALIEVDVDEETAILREPWAAISRAAAQVRQVRAPVTESADFQYESSDDLEDGRGSRTNPRPFDSVWGSSMNHMVELRGLEPLTFCLPDKCSTN